MLCIAEYCSPVATGRLRWQGKCSLSKVFHPAHPPSPKALLRYKSAEVDEHGWICLSQRAESGRKGRAHYLPAKQVHHLPTLPRPLTQVSKLVYAFLLSSRRAIQPVKLLACLGIPSRNVRRQAMNLLRSRVRFATGVGTALDTESTRSDSNKVHEY